MDDLDRALSTPLPTIADDAFSRRVAAGMAMRERRMLALEAVSVLTVIAALSLFVSLSQLFRIVETLSLDLGTSLPLAVGISALVLSHFTARFLAE